MRSDLIVFRTRFLTELSFVAVLSLLFMGCGGGDAASESSAETGDSSAQEAIEMETEAAMGMPGGEGGAHGMESMEGMAGMEAMDAGEAAGGEVAMPDDAAMMAGMEASYAGEAGYNGGPGMQGGQPQKPARPADVAQWTEDQLLAAVEERDPKVLQAIQIHATNAKGNPQFAELMTRVLQMDGGAPGAGGQGAAAPNANPLVPSLQGVPGGGAAAAEPGSDSSSAEAVPAESGIPAGGQPTRSNPVAPAGKGQSLQPSGGASLQRPVDSLEVMLGQSLLGYVPQAAQATRGAISNLQGNVNAAGTDPAMNAGEANSAAAAAATPGMNAAADSAMMQEMEGGYNGYEGGYAGGPGQRSGALESPQLVKAVAQALVINNTPAAWETLRGMAAGTVATPVSPAENIEIVLSEVFAAETINTPVAQQLLVSALQTVASNPAQHESTVRFLAALAQNPTDYFMKMWAATPPPAAPNPGQRPGSMNGMHNMAGGEMDSAMMAAMEAGAAGGEGMMAGAMPGEMGGMAGRLAAAAGPPLPHVRISEAAMVPVATALWSEMAVGAVAGQLSSANDPAEVPHLLAFASTIPSDAARHSLYNLFSKSHEQGATMLQALGLFRNVARDPGMLTVLKSLPRPRRARKKEGEAEVPDASTSWSAATEEVVLSLRDRLRTVATDPGLAHEGLQRLRLHRGAEPDQSIVIKVPDDRSQALGSAAPAETTVYYTSTTAKPERFSDMQKIADHYETRSKGIKHEDRARGILWYDGVKSNSDGTVETSDVMIEVIGGAGQQQQQGYEGGASGVGGQAMPQFRIEVIVVITKDPTTAAAEASAEADSPASTDQ